LEAHLPAGEHRDEREREVVDQLQVAHGRLGQQAEQRRTRDDADDDESRDARQAAGDRHRSRGGRREEDEAHEDRQPSVPERGIDGPEGEPHEAHEERQRHRRTQRAHDSQAFAPRGGSRVHRPNIETAQGRLNAWPEHPARARPGLRRRPWT
jgi:hypothetical protein